MRRELLQATELLRSSSTESLNTALSLLQKTVFSFSMKVCGHRDDAEDTVQEVLLRSLPYLRKIESPQALAVWLYKVTRNRCWLSRRRSKFAPEQTLSLEDLLPDSAELASLTQATGKNPEAVVASEQESQRVREAVLRIPARYRLVLVLHDMEELDTKEVAQILDISEGAVRVRLHRARLFVRRELSAPVNSQSPNTRKTKRPVDCRKMFSELSEFIDGRLDTISCEHIQKHLEDCPTCIAFINDLKSAIQRCKNVDISCPARLPEKIRNIYMQEYLRLSAPPAV